MAKMGNPNWEKGKSANPEGRPALKKRAELIAKFDELGLIDQAIEVLKQELSGKNKAEAAFFILNHTYGKPAQTTDVSVKGAKVLILDE